LRHQDKPTTRLEKEDAINIWSTPPITPDYAEMADDDADAITTVLLMDAHQLRFENGIVVHLASGGTNVGREYWAAAT
tara:strand:+ start:481 stop:714 length:234 start_codon:yes stop_codon:yes gene_type:complete